MNGYTTLPELIELQKLNSPGLKKSSTGINGLDEITFGGFPENRSCLIVGPSGSGKTFLAMEYILNGITKFGEPGVFMTFEEKTDELLINAATFDADLNGLVKNNQLYLENLYIDYNETVQSGRYNLDGLFIRLEQAIKKVKARRVALDALGSLFIGLNNDILRSEFKRLFSWLKQQKVTAVITAEIGEIYLTRLGLEEAVADCVIQLDNRVLNQIAIRRLRIIKYRGALHGNNEYPFIINPTGITVFPVISEVVQQQVSEERISSGIPQLDTMLEGKGFYKGSSVLIAGSAGTGKTSITVSFVREVCKSGTTCLYCAFEEAPNQIIRNMKPIGMPLQPFVDAGTLHFYYSRPTLQNLELHFIAIKKLIQQIRPGVIILDPVTNLMTEGINSDVRSMLTRFVDYIKAEQITVMFSAAITVSSMAINPSDEGISSMVDTCIMVQERQCDGAGRQRSLYIMKSRGINNMKEEVKFIISENGIVLDLPLIV